MNNQLYEQDFNLWRETIIQQIKEQRFRVKKDLEANPSFKNYLHEVISPAYTDARKLAIKESKNAKLGVRKPDESEYPLDFPFTLEQLLDEDFYGDVY
ncbi:DUF29 family protein [Trichormus variabilis]|uniref:DUF29 domain-containing protein n=1 Tax=Trichormus variabilis SAG 1403-4b TaxID=447716 RepID=A0A3S1A5H9_ANAVA|nr:DUF29 family protein [Trichormus variabilis]MBD2628695.1 DUF29 family protein [Trichormus variabilis FACHB-164]RUS94019.1 hypothetical protein DSM107003_39060 [Trichormus variabilis SAG 1403-4b]